MKLSSLPPFHVTSRHSRIACVTLILIAFDSPPICPSLPLPDIREFPRWRKRGIRLEATDTPDSFLLILSVLRYASNVCAVPPFHAFLSLFPLNFSSFFSFEARTQLLEIVDRLLRFFLPRYKVKKKRNSIRLATFPLILFLVLEDGYGYQCTDTLMEDRRFSSRSKINFFLEFLRSNSKWR